MSSSPPGFSPEPESLAGGCGERPPAGRGSVAGAAGAGWGAPVCWDAAKGAAVWAGAGGAGAGAAGGAGGCAGEGGWAATAGWGGVTGTAGAGAGAPAAAAPAIGRSAWRPIAMPQLGQKWSSLLWMAAQRGQAVMPASLSTVTGSAARASPPGHAARVDLAERVELVEH